MKVPICQHFDLKFTVHDLTITEVKGHQDVKESPYNERHIDITFQLNLCLILTGEKLIFIESVI